MVHLFAHMHFQDLARRFADSNLVFQDQDTFAIQNPRKQTFHLKRDLIRLFEQKFPTKEFCLYETVQYTVNNKLICKQYVLVFKIDGVYIDLFYSFFPSQRMYRTDIERFTEQTIPEIDDIVSFFLQTIEELPENRLLVTTNAVPLRYS